MHFADPTKLTDTSSSQIRAKLPISEGQNTANLYERFAENVVIYFRENRFERVATMSRQRQLEKYYRRCLIDIVFPPSSASQTAVITQIEPSIESSGSQLDLESIDAYDADLLIDEPLSFPPMRLSPVKLKITFIGKINPILNSDIEVDPYS